MNKMEQLVRQMAEEFARDNVTLSASYLCGALMSELRKMPAGARDEKATQELVYALQDYLKATQ